MSQAIQGSSVKNDPKSLDDCPEDVIHHLIHSIRLYGDVRAKNEAERIKGCQ